MFHFGCNSMKSVTLLQLYLELEINYSELQISKSRSFLFIFLPLQYTRSSCKAPAKRRSDVVCQRLWMGMMTTLLNNQTVLFTVYRFFDNSIGVILKFIILLHHGNSSMVEYPATALLKEALRWTRWLKRTHLLLNQNVGCKAKDGKSFKLRVATSVASQ